MTRATPPVTAPHRAALRPHAALRGASETKGGAAPWLWYPVAHLCALVNAISHCRAELCMTRGTFGCSHYSCCWASCTAARVCCRFGLAWAAQQTSQWSPPELMMSAERTSLIEFVIVDAFSGILLSARATLLVCLAARERNVILSKMTQR